MFTVNIDRNFTIITPSIEFAFIIRYKLKTFLYTNYIIGGFTYVYYGE